VLHRKLPLDSRQIPRPIHKKICPLSALSEHSNSVIRHVRLLRYGDATVAPVFPSAHSNRIFESARQLRCGVPQQLQHHQARTSAPHRRECTAAPVWGAAATPASPSAYISSTSSRVHGSSGVGCRSSSSITKRVHQLPERVRLLQCGVPQQLRHHQARTQLLRRFVFENADDNIERSGYGSKRRWQTTVVPEITSSLAANSWRTASRLEMYSTTDYREGRVVVLAKDFPMRAAGSISFAGGLRMKVRIAGSTVR